MLERMVPSMDFDIFSVCVVSPHRRRSSHAKSYGVGVEVASVCEASLGGILAVRALRERTTWRMVRLSNLLSTLVILDRKMVLMTKRQRRVVLVRVRVK